MDALGNICWWGFSPAIDLQSIYHEVKRPPNSDSDEVNILLVCAGDPRHIIKTIANRSKWPAKKTIRFYVFESRLELYARDCILLTLSIEHPLKRGIQEKTELFMEIFANILVRDQTAQYIKTISNEFVKFVTDSSYLKSKKLDLFDFSNLKHKETDFLEVVFKQWRNEAKDEYFPAERCWDTRLRTYFKTRYDSRANAFDWDFTMKFIDRKVEIINPRIYSAWRNKGIAFELRDADYNRPNMTLSSATVFDDPHKLDKSIRRGYFGDIVIGPFLCYGVETDKEELLKKSNDHYRHTSVDVTQSNVTELMQSIIKQKGFDSPTNDITEQVSELKIVELDENELEPQNIESAGATASQPESDYLHFDDFKIIYLPQSALERDLATKEKYLKHFDIVYYSNTGAASFNSSQKRSFKENAIVIFETAKYMIEMSKEQVNGFSRRLIEIANENGFVNFDNEKYERKPPPATATAAATSETTKTDESKIEVEKLNYFKFINKEKASN